MLNAVPAVLSQARQGAQSHHPSGDKPALTPEADWAGTRIAFFDEVSGKPEEASLFVAVLPFTRIIYAEPFRDEKLPERL